jgi:hypothetical protein
MKTNVLSKALLALAIGCAGVSLSSHAADGNYKVKFTTVPDVSIALVTALSFGQDLTLAPSSTCEMAVTTTANPGTIAGRIAQAVGGVYATGPETTYQNMTGNCDNTTKGTAGVYRITGAKGITVDITVNGIAPGVGDFSYAPSGIVSTYEGGTDADTFVAVTNAGNNATGSTTLANDSDLTTEAGSPIAGQALIFLGGEVTVQNQLLAGTSPTQQFTIDVVYQ